MPWDPLKIGSHVTLSVSDTVATIGLGGTDADQDCALGDSGLDCATTTGKRCFEIKLDPNAQGPVFGVATASQNVNSLLGATSAAWSWVAMAFTQAKFHNGNQGAYGISLYGSGSTYYVMVTIDFDAATVSFRYGSAPGVPAADFGVAFSGLAGVIYPAFGAGYGGPGPEVGTLNDAGPFFLDTESGATAWSSVPSTPRGSLVNLLRRL